MGDTKSNTVTANAVTRPVEGSTIWDETTLSFWFAEAADKAETESDDSVGEIFSPSPGTPSATYNPLSASDAGEKVIRDAFISSAVAFSNVTNLDFVPSASFDDADLKIVGADNYVSAGGSNLYGSMNFPGTNRDGILSPFTGEYESFMLMNKQLAIMTQAPVTGGGHFALTTVMHELGHGIGLGHPHDTGGGSTVMPGSTSGPVDDVPLDNERYTIMSYESGGLNQDSPRTNGHAVTPMALDIAALHSMYGARAFNTTNTTYSLTNGGSAALDLVGPTISIGSAWYCIWDTGGDSDEIVYSGARRTILNLNDATLATTDDVTTQNWIDMLKSTTAFAGLSGELKNDLANAAYHAGGFFSRIIDGGVAQLGGYSIANGAEIENATGGTGDDIIIGNELDNLLKGNGGNDVILASAGNDTVAAGIGDDTVAGGEGDDSLDGGGGDDVALYSESCDNYEIVKDEATGKVTITHVEGSMIDGTDVLTGIETARFSNGDVDLTEDEPGCPPIDFIFLVDLSGSYSDDLPNFKAAAPSIASIVRAIDPDSRFALASFVDLPVSPYGSSGDYPYRPELALTEDTSAFEAAVGGLSIFSGGDFPESQLFGLDRAARGIGLGLRENSQKIILIATDASAHSAADYGVDEGDLAAFLDDNDIDVIGGAAPREVIDPTLVGDTDPDFDDGIGDPLLRSFITAAGIASATPIFAVTAGSEAYYEGIAAKFPGVAPVVPLSSSGDDISDALSAALAEIAGSVTATGDSTSELIEGTPGDDGLLGLGGNDTIRGFSGNDVLDGGSDDDLLEGGLGNDDLRGGTGDDMLLGGGGDDTLVGGLGLDTLTGNDGADTFRGSLAELFGDTITDFTAGTDQILIVNQRIARGELSIRDGAVLGYDLDANGTVDADEEFTLEGGFRGGAFMTALTATNTVLSFATLLPALAEGRALAADLANGIGNQAYLTGDGTIEFKVTLRDLGFAAYSNALGVYEVDSSGAISDVRLLFDNTNANKSATATITDVEDGHRLGFFIVQDAAGWASALKGSDMLSFINGSGAAGSIADGSDLALAVNGSAVDEMVFHSFSEGLNTDGKQHVVSGAGADGNSMTVGFEDLTGLGDRDFEDVVFRVEADYALI